MRRGGRTDEYAKLLDAFRHYAHELKDKFGIWIFFGYHSEV